MKRNLSIHQNILGLIGETPMIKLNKITKDLDGEFLVKFEGYNPGHSTKDRIALYIIEQAEKQGILKPGSTIVETTSGNTGFSLAMVSISKGYQCILAVSSKSSNDKIDMLKAMGAKVYVCPANVSADDPRSYYQVAKRLHAETELNIDAHYNSTGPEIWKQTEGKITHLVAASGTGGTISGTAKYLKEQNPDIKILGVDAFGSILKKFHETGVFDKNEIYPYRIEGLGKNLIPTATDFDVIDKFEKVSDEDSAHRAREIALTEAIFAGYTSGAVMQAVMQYAAAGEFDKNEIYPYITEGIGEDFLPANVDFDIIDHFEQVTDKDAAIYTRRIAREEGILAGNSAGSAMAGIDQMKHLFKEGDVVVVIFHDHGIRYLGKMFNDNWMRDRGFIEENNPKAIHLIENHKNLKMITVSADAKVEEALNLMQKYNISQIPVTKGEEYVGSLNDNYLYAKLIADANLKNNTIASIMQAPFPFVDPQDRLEVVSKKINKENSAVLMRDWGGNLHIITKYDVIQAIG